MGDNMKKILLAVIVSLLVPGLATAANITYADKVTGGSFSAADANEIKSAVNSKADALGADDNYLTDAEKTRIGELESTDVPVFAGVDLGVANTTFGLLRFFGNTKAFSFGLYSDGADGIGVGWKFPSAMATGDSVVGVNSSGVLSYLPSTAIVATGFNGNLAATDDTVQEVAQKFDDYVGGSAPSDTAYDATTWDANTDAATKNAIRDKIETLAGGHDAATINATANGLSITGQVIALGLASTSTIGALSDTDWDTFNNKVSYTPATPGAIGGTTPAAGTFTTLSAGAAGFSVDADGDVTAKSYLTSAADGSRYTILPNNTTIAPLADGSEEVYNEGGQIKVVEADTEYDLLNSGDVGTAIQAYDADLATWAGVTPGTGVGTMLATAPGAEGGPTTTIEYGTSALGTAEIASGACASAVTTTATNAATTDVINWGFNADPTSTTGYAPTANGMLTIIAYPSSGNVNFKVCNLTAAAITPGAVTLNWRIQR